MQLSRPAQGQDATLSFAMKGPVLSLSFPYPQGRAITCVIGPSLQKRKVWAVHRVFFISLSFHFCQWVFGFLPHLIFGNSTSRGSGWATAPKGNVSLVLLRFEVCLCNGMSILCTLLYVSVLCANASQLYNSYLVCDHTG
jgi:hypothetical protein